jgi:hypothetical protein
LFPNTRHNLIDGLILDRNVDFDDFNIRYFKEFDCFPGRIPLVITEDTEACTKMK